MQIVEVEAHAVDLPALARFYATILELPTEWHGDQLLVQVGASRLRFVAGASHLYHWAFNIPANQLEAAAAWLQGKVSLLSDADHQQRFRFASWNAESIYFLDPAGNILECIARHRLDNASTQPFGPGSFLSISEIGLAVDEVVASSEDLCARLAEKCFDGACNPHFAAMGDDHGLLIMVQRGRIWYPDTGVAAQVCPLKVTLNGGRQLISTDGGLATVTRIAKDQAQQLRTIRLQALEHEPAAFCSTWSREQALPDSFWEERTALATQGSQAAIFLAFQQTQLVGMAGIRQLDGGNADIWGVYLAEHARGTGLGRALLQATLDWAQLHGHQRVTLECNENLTGATTLYTNLGFRQDGRLTTLSDGRRMPGWTLLRA